MPTIFFSAFSGLPSLRLVKPQDTLISELVEDIQLQLPQNVIKSTYISLKSGRLLYPTDTVRDLLNEYGPDYSFLDLRLNGCLCGGKGGFGSMLKAQGTKMSRKKNKNTKEYTDSLRNLDGVRLKTIRQAKELHAHLESAPSREKEAVEKKKAKLKAIIEGSQKVKPAKFSDEQYLEQREQLVNDVREAVGRSTSAQISPSSSTQSAGSAGSSRSSSLASSSSSKHSAKKPKAMGFFSEEEDESE